MNEEERQAIERLKHLQEFISFNPNSKCRTHFAMVSYTKETYTTAIDTVLNLVDKQNKIIDLMAEQLTTPTNSKEWVIKYYEEKVSENR